ncbi:aminopeptidase P N-terminal domain-containing protein [Solimicrobium silvestre]|uniref:Xaa-Pro aminopeptidase n=1 Tax=Solimicrobium silvestre TaxID=2099400 RepID=A0A2S9H1D1_9BURK|nr:aminopeptidase P N-terminal domain-containing protein [Solimicrobium silvestre]PRC93753.1 Xaa-Pro aminopeptidase [Solimicrobium silvestre]
MNSTFKSYLDRRASLLAQMQAQGGGVAILATAPEMTRNSDCFFPFRHDSYFYYLTGFTEPEAVVVLVAGKTQQSILFCREKNLEREIWDGFRYGPQAAQAHFGFDAAYPIEELEQQLANLLADAPTIFHTQGYNNQLDTQLQRSINTVRGRARSGVLAPQKSTDLHALLNEMRLIKDASEIALMQRAASISAVAHQRAMQITLPGLFEYELEAELLHEFRRQGSQSPAYGSIVATGANACVLHYSANNAKITDGDLILIDAGCEFDSYASDVTRTFPANGKFNAPQKTLYELVLAAQSAALAHAKIGARYIDGHNAAIQVLTQGMLDTGLLDKNKVGSLEDAISSNAYRQFYMHGTGHWIGMDVHDVGNYRVTTAQNGTEEKPYRQLQAGMAITIEPGIYVRPAEGVPEQFWNIGIRIEDDIIITENGPLNLSRDTPKTVAEIEEVMRRK